MLKLASIFNDHMVIQQGIPCQIWGWATPGASISLLMAEHAATAIADTDGAWRAALSPLPVGGPYTLTIAGDGADIAIRDVLVGEVWLCSGQSNMEMTVDNSAHAGEEIAAAQDAGIRCFTVPTRTELHPSPFLDATWQVCSPETVGAFTAVGYFFGRELRKRLGGAPIGLINCSVGGTVAEAWTSREGLLAEPSLRHIAEDYATGLATHDEQMTAYQVANDAWESKTLRKDPGNAGWAEGWGDPAASHADWETMEAPGSWQSRGLAFNGVLWFRKTVVIPEAWSGKALVLSLCPCDKSDQTYFNNVLVGGLSIDDDPMAWNIPRVYTIPAECVHAGENLIAVRIYSHIHAGGFMGADHLMALKCPEDAGNVIPLAGSWAYRVEQNFGYVEEWPPVNFPLGPGNGNSPHILFDNKIAPLVPFGIRGAIWYQGESNADRAYQYRILFPAMIHDWRRAWQLGDFPFYFVQLANYMAPSAQPMESAWADLREAQTLTLALPNTGMAVIIDIGEEHDIHPKNKQDVGLRLALLALARTYGQELVDTGPQYRDSRVVGHTMRLRFDSLGGGLCCHGKQLVGFAIAGEDQQFVWADAVIDGDEVIVSSPAIAVPCAVRYGWADNPRISLYNQAGLPAGPFRTDDWPIAGELELSMNGVRMA